MLGEHPALLYPVVPGTPSEIDTVVLGGGVQVVPRIKLGTLLLTHLLYYLNSLPGPFLSDSPEAIIGCHLSSGSSLALETEVKVSIILPPGGISGTAH